MPLEYDGAMIRSVPVCIAFVALLAISAAGCTTRPTPGPQKQKTATPTISQAASSAPSASQPTVSSAAEQFMEPEAEPGKVLERTASGLTRIDGQTLRNQIRATHAKATLVNAWASWCGSCKHELPMLQKVAREFASQGVQLLLVSVDDPEQEQSAAELLGKLGFTQLGFVAAAPLESFKMAMHPDWPGMIPATFLFDADGKLRYFWGGEAFESELRPVVERFLRGERIDGAANYKVAPE
jgi:thiol-disulfide isomerase/thioredoxin